MKASVEGFAMSREPPHVQFSTHPKTDLGHVVLSQQNLKFFIFKRS